MVESQAQAATLSLVDTLEEQRVLEELLEGAKPPAVAPERHYLLGTPFRYPPLRHGSRFGIRTRRGIFYAALSERTALCECAWYRFLFLDGMTIAPGGPIVSGHTTFHARIRTARAIALDAAPFDAHRAVVSDPSSAVESQAIGEAMREAGVEAFTYHSARDPKGRNIAAFTPAAIASRRPLRPRQWTVRTEAERVICLADHDPDAGLTFARELFLVDGALPSPATQGSGSLRGCRPRR